jgi:AraC-like DNA-binding protein
MAFGLTEASARLPFIKLPGASLASANDLDFGGVVGAYLPLTVHRWDHPHRDLPFFNHSGCIRLADLTLLATWGSAIQGEVEQKCDAQLVLPYPAGVNIFTIEKRSFRFRSSCLFIPAAHHRIQLDCSHCSGIIISFPPETLLPVAHAVAGPGFDPLSLQAALSQPTVLCCQADSRRDQLHALLRQTMAYAEQCLAIGGEIHPMLRLDDLIRRLILMLLLPSLLEPATTAPVSSEPFPHQELVTWLLAHLHQPISLSDMEQLSNYSRRSLQYAFKKRYGCGPMQWLRQQRLVMAKALLEKPDCQRGLRGVAQACGYLSLASFRRDFVARYGECPSRVQRRFRNHSPLEGIGD